jgi:hypothetical protein
LTSASMAALVIPLANAVAGIAIFRHQPCGVLWRGPFTPHAKRPGQASRWEPPE